MGKEQSGRFVIRAAGPLVILDGKKEVTLTGGETVKKYEIVKKKTLTPEIGQISVYAPLVAAKAEAGQFIILRVDE